MSPGQITIPCDTLLGVSTTEIILNGTDLCTMVAFDPTAGVAASAFGTPLCSGTADPLLQVTDIDSTVTISGSVSFVGCQYHASFSGYVLLEQPYPERAIGSQTVIWQNSGGNTLSVPEPSSAMLCGAVLFVLLLANPRKRTRK